MPEDVNKETPIAALIQMFQGDITHDGHSLPIRLNRSDAAKELVRRGRTILGDIGNHLADQFETTTYPPDLSDEQDLFIAWISILYRIGTADAEIQAHLPYPLAVQVQQHDMDKWVSFCLRHAAVCG